MPVKLIQADEKNVWKHEETGAGFIFRRPSRSVIREIQAKHTDKGKTDEEAVTKDLFEYAIFDWFGFVDKDGVEVSFRKDYLPSVPDMIFNSFIFHLYSLNPEAAEIKN